jgi:hypothetical protein
MKVAILQNEIAQGKFLPTSKFQWNSMILRKLSSVMIGAAFEKITPT